MHQFYPAPQACLSESEIIDFRSAPVQRRAASLAAHCASEMELIEKTFIFVRDSIAHSVDCGGTAVTCSASEVLHVGQGLCYAKAHLLAALLRANGIAAGIVFYTALKVVTGKWKQVHWMMYLLFVLVIVRYIFLAEH